jgi:HPt (histidine-containing phosphotransfer) domain-containing protein/HAMP domain-containing protein
MRFGITRKLLSVCLAFTLPIVVMLVLMTRTQLAEIEFTSKELRGDAYQRPLQDVLEHAAKHQRLVTRRTIAGTALDPQIRDEELAVAAALQRLEAADRAHGETLQFTPEGLGLRKRTDFTAQSLRRKWHDLLSARPHAAPQALREKYQGIVSHVRTMITHAGDTSNLILDPDLDSYYLMDVSLLALPQMEGRLHQIATEVTELLAAGELDSESRVRVATLSALLEEADWERVVASTHTAINEDPNFQGTSRSLSESLLPRLRTSEAAIGKVLTNMRLLASAPTIAGFDRATFEADLDALATETFALHRTALDEEDRLLQTRVDAFQRHLYLGWALAGASLLVSAFLAFALSKNITSRVAHISATTKSFAAGSMAVRVGRAGSDELGELGESFNDMADQLAELNANLEATVEERTRELRQRNEAVRLILDNAHDGMLSVDLNGLISSERSAAVDRWFGTPRVGATLPGYLGAENATLAAELELSFDELRADIMPLELILDQFPRRLVQGGLHFQFEYQPIVEDGRLSRLLVIISDVTSEIENRRAEALQEETVRIFQACQRDQAGFLDFFVNAREIAQLLSTSAGCSSEEISRAIHTLKGNCALFGVFSLSSLCHEIEDRMAENGAILADSDVALLTSAWEELSRTVTQIVGDHRSDRLEVADDEYAAIVDAIAHGVPRREILVAIASWKLEPTARRLHRFAERARELARRLGKDLEVSVEPNNLRLCAETWGPVWAALSHVIRNSIDHGIEPADLRQETGKSSVGHLRITTRLAAHQVWLEVTDDGRGIAWERVAAAATAKGLPHETRADLVEALFADGVSTATSVTEISGRGVGMSAMRAACRALGGSIDIDSEPGRGTTIRCRFPEQAAGGRAMASAQRRSINPSLAPLS